MIRHPILAICVLTIAGAFAEPTDLSLPRKPLDYTRTSYPPHFSERLRLNFDNTPDSNPITNAGATLGRVLFYDTRLSANHAVSCGSCHQQKHAFADPRTFSAGFEGHPGDRNSMSLVNLRFNRPGFFWDARADTVETAVTRPIRNLREMGHSPEELIATLAADPYYPALFEKAFGDPEVSIDRVARSLAQFVRSLVSADSRYDRAAAKEHTFTEDFSRFTAAENLGKSLFAANCALCHTQGSASMPALFTTFSTLNNGIDPDTSVADGGEGDVTLNPSQVGLFRPPSLRNVERTAPYMHDGRFATLEEVIHHYSDGVMNHPSTGPVRRMQFDGREKAALIAFLKTLTDENFLNDPRFSDPWKRPTPNYEASRNHQASTGRDPLDTPAWIMKSDIDGDQQLSSAELDDLATRLEPLHFTSLYPGFRGRAPRTRRSDPPADPRADADDDGTITTEEAATFSTFARMIRFSSGTVREVRYDRFLDRFNLSGEEELAVRRFLREQSSAVEAEIKALDQALLSETKSALTPDQFDLFRTLAIRHSPDATASRAPLKRPAIRKKITDFDSDQDGKLSRLELELIAKAIASRPGGLYGRTARVPAVEHFHDRFMKFDADGDGQLSSTEVPERLAYLIEDGDQDRSGTTSTEELSAYLLDRSFGHALDEGVSVGGGGFDDLLAQSAHLLDELDISAETHATLRRRFETHRLNIKSLREAALTKATPSFNSLINPK